MAEIEAIKIKNFRGVRTEVDLSLPDGQSFLLYGDNGTGKSTFLDAIEWYITDQVSHLCGEEIETHGGLRNALCADGDECHVAISFKTPNFSDRKALTRVKGKLKSSYATASTVQFESFLDALSRDHLWLRNRNLVEFILGTKAERLSDLSDIIGFEPVSTTKATLRKAANDIKTAIKHKNFQEYINLETNTISKNLGAVVHSEDQFLKASNALLANVAAGIQANSLQELKAAIKTLSGAQESPQAKQLRAMQSAEAAAETVQAAASAFNSEFAEFAKNRDTLKKDAVRLKQVVLSKLLDEAARMLANHEEDNCPLCLQAIPRDQLRDIISRRIAELKQVNIESASLETTRRILSTNANHLASITKALIELLEPLRADKHVDDLTNLATLLASLGEVAKDLNESVLNQNVQYEASLCSGILSLSKSLAATAKIRAGELAAQVSDVRIEAVGKLSVAKEAFEKSLRLKRESDILSSHQRTLEALAAEFTKRQRDGMEIFLSAISNSMNEYYCFMNEDKKVDDVKLVCLTDEASGEFSGVAVNYLFHGQPAASPKELLSESHINCLGLCLFLATVKKFNKQGKFIVLDDVISSFDKNHRARFAQLLVTKFSDHQLLVFTHETEWYEHLSFLVKSAGWKILQTRWSIDDGTSLTVLASNIKERIDEKIKSGQEDDLGNLIRRYGEQLLKEIAHEINAPVPFRFNEHNEARNFDELYSAIRSQLKKHTDISDHEAVAGLATCQFFSNKTSHASGYKPNMADLKVALADMEKFVGLFRCDKCKRFVGIKNHNAPEKKITCKCGEKDLQWKE